jgi:hypothetical protein
MVQDLRWGLQMPRNPLYAAVAILTLALRIGAKVANPRVCQSGLASLSNAI